MQPTHSVHVLGGARIAGPRTKPNGVVHANGCEKESEEEEVVIMSLGVVAQRATHEIGGWTFPAAYCLRHTNFERQA